MAEPSMSAPSNGDEFYCGPFDPDELVRWAETYGDPEQWAKKAQSLHGKVERVERALGEVSNHHDISLGAILFLQEALDG